MSDNQPSEIHESSTQTPGSSLNRLPVTRKRSTPPSVGKTRRNACPDVHLLVAQLQS